MSSDPSPDPVRERGLFPTTSWTVIRSVREGTEEQARAALEAFCRTYWYPVYAYCRHYGFPVETAEDLTQTYCPPRPMQANAATWQFSNLPARPLHWFCTPTDALSFLRKLDSSK